MLKGMEEEFSIPLCSLSLSNYLFDMIIKTKFSLYTHAFISLMSLISLASFQGIPAPITELFSRDAFVFEPTWIRAEAGHRLWVSDAVHERYALYRYDLEADQVSVSLPLGRGPGELARVGMKWMSQLPEGDIMIYDTGAYRATRYTAELKNPRTLPLPRMNVQSMSAHLLGERTLLLNPMSTTQVLSAFSYDVDTKQSGAQRYEISLQVDPALSPLSNFLLKNGVKERTCLQPGLLPRLPRR